MTTTDVLVLAALIGAIAGALTTFILASLRRAFNDWRLRRIRVCAACKGLRVIDGHIVHTGEAIDIGVPCPVCNPVGRFPRRSAKIARES